MTKEEWLAFQEDLREMERRYGKEVLYRYGGDGPRAVLYFKTEYKGLVQGDVMQVNKDNATLRVRSSKGGEAPEDKDFKYQQLYTPALYEKYSEELRAPGKTFVLMCKVCGKEFESKAKDRATCSVRCTSVLKRKGGKVQGAKGTGLTISKPLTEEERQRVCPVCGVHFRAAKRTQKCCGRTCGLKLRAKTVKAKKETMKLSDTLKGCKL